MTDATPPTESTTRRFTPAGILFAALGLVLFAYYIWHADPRAIWQNMLNLGAGFLLILLISAVRPLVRSLAWMRCFEEPHALRLRDALRAYLAGDALGSIMPFGMVVSEPTKAALVRDRVPLSAGIAAIAVENLFYSLSVALFIATGMITVLLSFPQMPMLVRYVCMGTLAGVGVVVLCGYFIIRFEWRFVSRLLEFLYMRRVFSGWLETRRVRVAAVEDRIYGFYARNRARFLPILALETCFHLAGVAENYVTLYFISPVRPTLLAAFALESVNRIINIVFKVVPLRAGVDEAVTGWFTKALQLGEKIGISLAIVRKARIVVWAAVGILLLVRQGLSPRAAVSEAQASIAAHRSGAKAPREQAG